jgi:hypothetical protein
MGSAVPLVLATIVLFSVAGYALGWLHGVEHELLKENRRAEERMASRG